MPYGVNKWDKQPGRALAAGSSSASSTRTAKLSKTSSAPAARKKKKAKAKSAATPKKQRACKYGPRDADGYCPKKPKAAKKKSAKKSAAKSVKLYDPETGKVFVTVKSNSDELAQYLDEGYLAKKPPMVYRYNPESGRRVQVPSTSMAADDWPTRKPAKTLQGLISQGGQIGGSAGAAYVGTRVAGKIEKKVATSVKRALAKGAVVAVKGVATAAGISQGAAVSSIIAAALIGWNLGKAINYAVGSMDNRLDAALRNYVNARKEVERRLGRPLTKAEIAPMYAAYKEVVVRLKANDPSTFLRPGAE